MLSADGWDCLGDVGGAGKGTGLGNGGSETLATTRLVGRLECQEKRLLSGTQILLHDARSTLYAEAYIDAAALIHDAPHDSQAGPVAYANQHGHA
jgi:hypothetical protein